MKKKYTKEDYANAYAQNKEGRRQLLDLRLLELLMETMN